MSWRFSRALVEEFLQASYSDGERFAPWNGIPIAPAYCLHGRTTTISRPFPSGMTFAPLTVVLGAELLEWFLEAFPVKPIPLRLQEKTLLTISGRKCGGSWQMSLPGTSLPRTSSEERSIEQRTTSRRWVTKPEQFPFPRRTWVQTTFGKGIGFLHTPTTQGNYCAPSMQKHACCRAWVTVFGRVTPEAQEWLMDWPVGWSALQPLETDKFLSWRSQHFSSLSVLKEAL